MEAGRTRRAETTWRTTSGAMGCDLPRRA